MFAILVIKCQNSIIYIYKKLNFLLYNWQSFIKFYINNVIIYLKICTKYVAYFCNIFTLIISYNINIKFVKTILDYIKINILS